MAAPRVWGSVRTGRVERSAFVSLAFSLLCLSAAALPTFGQFRRAAVDRQSSAEMQSLVGDLAVQLRFAYRDNLPEFARRVEQLRSAIRAWNSSPQTASDRQQMTAWLRDAIRRSMPGSTVALPELPTFSRPAAAAELPATSLTVHKPATDEARDPSPPAEAPAEARAVPDVLAAEVDPSNADDPTPARPPSVWERHPAAGELPADLLEGDPFLDDSDADSAADLFFGE